MNAIEDGTLDQCQRLGILPMAWSPWAAAGCSITQDTAAQRIRAAMATIAGNYEEAKPERLALAWVLAHPSRPMAVFGTNRPERIESLAAAATSPSTARTGTSSGRPPAARRSPERRPSQRTAASPAQRSGWRGGAPRAACRPRRGLDRTGVGRFGSRSAAGAIEA